jgi:methionyl-tRNA formyltransferase
MKIVFMGTPDFAVPCLEKLIKTGHDIVGVFTQPDKPVGRKQILTPSDIKVCAEKHNIPVFTPKTLRNGAGLELLKQLEPELVVVVAYGKILPEDVLAFPKYGCINVHGSLLPKYRGAAPIQWSILNGDKITGVTTMLMDAGVDTGDILLQRETEIGENETAGELFDRLSILGAELLEETLLKLTDVGLSPVKQDERKATTVTQLDKSFSPVDFNCDAHSIHNQVRGLNPWPSATFIMDGVKFKLHETRPAGRTDKEAGTVLESKKRLVVACGNGTSVEILTLQPEGRNRMSAADYLRGHEIRQTNLLR